MAGDWIKMRVNLADDPAVVRLGNSLKITRHEAVGLLHYLWGWADAHTDNGVVKGVNSEWLDTYTRKPGLAAALESVGWLEITGDGLVFPNFDRHNGSSAKKRAYGTARQRVNRERAKEKEAVPSQPSTPRVPSKVQSLVSVTKKEFAHLLEDPRRKAALGLWVKHRQASTAKGYTDVSARTFLKKVAGMSIEEFAASVEHSVSNNYTGLYSPSGGARGKTKRKTAEESSESRGDYPESGDSGPELA